MAETWHIARRSRSCAKTGRAITPGEPFYSALREQDDGFSRLDFSVAAWPETDKDEFFSYWKNKVATDAGDKKPPVDYERLVAFFHDLEGAAEAPKRLLRYVLALALIRRRHLRLDDMSPTEVGDRLVVHDRQSGKTLEIIAPEADREELMKTQEALNQLFDCEL